MKIKVITFNGNENIYDAIDFEFRSNQVSNWIKIQLKPKGIINAEITIHNVCVVKTID